MDAVIVEGAGLSLAGTCCPRLGIGDTEFFGRAVWKARYTGILEITMTGILLVTGR
jgi:hypothetical protein